MIKKLTLCILIIASQSAYSIVYYKSISKGEIAPISFEEFEKCQNIIYRKAAKKELTPKHKKALLKALILGDAINSTEVAISTLKSNPGFCSYGDEGEKFE